MTHQGDAMTPLLSRRTFIGGLATLPLLRYIDRPWTTLASAVPMTRYDAYSTDGKKMLKSYAIAVRKMKALPPSDPRSWKFQWYTHAIPGSHGVAASNAAKAAALAAAFAAPSPARQLADEMWNTCQSHSPWGMNEEYFLPWHRMYLYYFESIVREVSGDSTFTLPYWDYSAVSTPAVRGIIPPEFTKKGDATYGSLFMQNRRPDVNKGKALPPDAVSLDVLGACDYADNSGGGFNPGIDGTPHGAVHVEVGDLTNMGDVPTAAGDPIFWLHHANIDRLWASWQAGERPDPTVNVNFVFADASGARVSRNAGDFLKIASLNYQYDRLETLPAQSCPVQAVAQVPTPLYRNAARVPLTANSTVVRLTPAGPAGAVARPLSAVAAALPAGRRLYLVANGLSTNTQPGVRYRVYLDLPANASPAIASQHFAGSLNFFDAVRSEADTARARPRALTLDITRLTRTLGNRLASTTPTITIVPAGRPLSEARPVVGELSIIER